MRCLGRLGCLAVLIVLAAAAWFTRNLWRDRVPFFGRDSAAAVTSGSSAWQPLTTDGSARARTMLQRLEGHSGPVYVNVAPGDLAAYIFQELSGALPRGADSVEASAIGDELFVRAVLPTALLGDRKSLGPMAALLGERERVQFGGRLRILRPGLAEFRVTELKLRDFTLPRALIPRIVGQMARNRPADIAAHALPLRTPSHIADVRVANGMVTMYKTLPATTATPTR
jgi:hypothetical protein